MRSARDREGWPDFRNSPNVGSCLASDRFSSRSPTVSGLAIEAVVTGYRSIPRVRSATMTRSPAGRTLPRCMCSPACATSDTERPSNLNGQGFRSARPPDASRCFDHPLAVIQPNSSRKRMP